MKEKGMKDEDAGDVLIDQAILYGTKRLASEEFLHDWEHKRLNSGHGPGFDQRVGATSDPKPGAYPSYPILIPVVTSNWPGPFPFPPQAATTTFLGKGAKQWRSGDWICAKCNNHNYASRAQCNRSVDKLVAFTFYLLDYASIVIHRNMMRLMCFIPFNNLII
ncbi:uncharacterized protein LOC120185742 [Hibiscus syriacus]|uniref:uncharacterized protein LOC120185742 n=1 Tax=Hibiscus syriacus TaxID=106335 RepID=UPI001922F12D|nr:uncharacterized protein LOC120185742 [Hibiscus syriacus]